jgi:aspartate 1-decarboxylase
MQIQVVKSKIHRVKVTGADLNYIGSITIDEALMDNVLKPTQLKVQEIQAKLLLMAQLHEKFMLAILLS